MAKNRTVKLDSITFTANENVDIKFTQCPCGSRVLHGNLDIEFLSAFNRKNADIHIFLPAIAENSIKTHVKD